MSFTQVQKHIQWRASLVLEGRFDDLAHHCVLPMTVEIEATSFVISTREALIAQFHRVRAGLQGRGIAAMIPVVDAVELRSDPKRVWVTWHAKDQFGVQIATSKSVFMITRFEGRPCVSGMSHSSILVPELAAWAKTGHKTRFR